MALIDDNHTDGFSFIWTIENFSYCAQKTKTDKLIHSPQFSLDSNNPEVLVTLFLKGNIYDNGNFYMRLKKLDTTQELRVDSVFSIRTIGGSYKQTSGKVFNNSFKPGIIWRYWRKQDIFKKGTDSFLENDTLTIRCRIIKVDDTILESEQCYAHTIVRVQKSIYTWTLNDLKGAKELDTKKQINLSEITSFKVNVSMTEEKLSEDKFEVTIKLTNTNKCYFSACIISLLNAEKVLDSVRNEHWFTESNFEQIWKSSFTPKPSFLTISKQNSNIYLQCEIGVSFGIENSKIVKVVYGSTVDRPTTDRDILRAWKDNMQCFYSVGELCDFTIRTPRKEFPVHKAMLGAQSTVFCAMFERDTKEYQTGIFEIKDLEEETVSMMLLFVYTCSIEDLDWEKASKLYFAADKYKMSALKEKCSNFFKENLATWNACKCLILADMHQDQDLKSVVQDYFIKHSNDIVMLDEWKELRKEKPHLAVETMQLISMHNLKV